MELGRRGAELLFQVLTEREERSAVAIASNEPFSSEARLWARARIRSCIRYRPSAGSGPRRYNTCQHVVFLCG
jgi:hypothetical protein